ncbi:NTP transferase domain-containing protein [Streptomyces tateyamensis]|uniref:NTP transferase domain-containing protein n=1 Tax=Streptomyces tateyamensis TaxID=565073 RepID=UPI001FE9754C|nr:NTP transferase domain-containing protein [Streptomyces tateyamensis]
MTPGYDAVVLAGGAARRLGGADKPRLVVGGRSMLDRVLAACSGAGQVVVVGPGSGGAVRWTREQPPGGGPVAAVAAGLAVEGVTAPVLLLLAADLPFLDRPTLDRLAAAVTGEVQAAVLVDAAGRAQPLAGAYRRDALCAALAALGEPGGQPLRRLVGGLRTVELPDPQRVAVDCDTWPELAEARRRAGSPVAEADPQTDSAPAEARRRAGSSPDRPGDGEGNEAPPTPRGAADRAAWSPMGRTLDDWMTEAAAELGIDLAVDRTELLDLARVVAHAVARPAAPLTAFLVGYAAAARGGGAAEVAAASARVTALAERWAAEQAPTDGPGA